MSTDDKIRAFFRDQFLVEMGVDAQEESHLFETGIVDSYGFVELVKFLEREFSLSISNDELMSNSLTSYAAILLFVEAKLHG